MRSKFEGVLLSEKRMCMTAVAAIFVMPVMFQPGSVADDVGKAEMPSVLERLPQLNPARYASRRNGFRQLVRISGSTGAPLGADLGRRYMKRCATDLGVVCQVYYHR